MKEKNEENTRYFFNHHNRIEFQKNPTMFTSNDFLGTYQNPFLSQNYLEPYYFSNNFFGSRSGIDFD